MYYTPYTPPSFPFKFYEVVSTSSKIQDSKSGSRSTQHGDMGHEGRTEDLNFRQGITWWTMLQDCHR